MTSLNHLLGLAVLMTAAQAQAAGPAGPEVAVAVPAQAAAVQASAPAGGGAAAAKGPSASDQLSQARTYMRALYDGVQQIGRVGGMTGSHAVRTNCVSEKLAEARVGVTIGNQEMARIQGTLAADAARDAQSADDRAYALLRLKLLVERARDLEKAAQTCAQDERSSVNITQVEVEISPGVDENGVSLDSPPRAKASR